MTAVREAKIEDYLSARAKALGGVALKFPPVSFVGLPDRLVLLPGGRVGFLELKRLAKEPTGVQHWWLGRLTELGFIATWTDSHAGVDAFLSRMIAAK